MQDKFVTEKAEKTKLERQFKENADKGGVNPIQAKEVEQLKNEVRILSMKQKQVVAYNPQTSSFEYIGEPIPLRPDKKPCTSLNEILTLI